MALWYKPMLRNNFLCVGWPGVFWSVNQSFMNEDGAACISGSEPTRGGWCGGVALFESCSRLCIHQVHRGYAGGQNAWAVAVQRPGLQCPVSGGRLVGEHPQTEETKKYSGNLLQFKFSPVYRNPVTYFKYYKSRVKHLLFSVEGVPCLRWFGWVTVQNCDSWVALLPIPDVPAVHM